MSHYNVNVSVPKTLIQYLIRWVVSTRQFDDDAANATLISILDTEISPELVPPERRVRARPRHARAKHAGQSRPLRAAGLQLSTMSPATATGPSKVAFLSRHAWSDKAAGRVARLPARKQARGVRPADHQALAARVLVALLQNQPVQAQRDPQRSQRSAPAARCRPAATGAPPRTRKRRPGSTSWSATCRTKPPLPGLSLPFHPSALRAPSLKGRTGGKVASARIASPQKSHSAKAPGLNCVELSVELPDC